MVKLSSEEANHVKDKSFHRFHRINRFVYQPPAAKRPRKEFVLLIKLECQRRQISSS